MAREPLNLIIDTDPGIDDACALSAALGSPRLRVRAVIATGGNVPARTALRNLRRVLAVCRPTPMPLVGVGLDPPGRGLDATHIHGPDGLAEVPVEPARVAAENACAVVARVLEQCRGELALLALAPLTTVRWLLAQVPDFRARLSRVVVMGGAVSVPGNVSPVAEFNFWRDPEAAASVIAMELPLRLVPLDVTERWEVSAETLRRRLVRRTPKQRFLRHILGYAVRTHRERLDRGALVHDLVALAAAVRPGLFRWQRVPAEVEARGVLTRGMLVVERRPQARVRPNLTVATAVRRGPLAEFLWGMLQ